MPVLWLRGIVFTLLVPCVIAAYVPHQLIGSRLPHCGLWQTGWLLIFLGSTIYFCCLISFLSAHGTPAIFFTRHLRIILGTEPPALVRKGLYRFSRNPMYLAVVTAIAGQAILYHSGVVFVYGVVMFLLFHCVVIFIEEPHLRARDPKAFEEYSHEAPRWFGWPN